MKHGNDQQQRDSRGGRKRSHLTAALALVVGAALGLLVAEGALRLWFRDSLDLDMEMWKYATQIKAVSPDPHLGYVHRPNRSALLMGVEVATNDFGLRDDTTMTLVKPPGTYRIAVFGDSFTMGWGVEADRVFPMRLQKLLKASPPAGFPRDTRFQVLNFGVGNYNTAQEVALLRSLGQRFDPDLVLFAYFINDAEVTTPTKQGWLIEHSYLIRVCSSCFRRLPWMRPRRLDYRSYYRLSVCGRPPDSPPMGIGRGPRCRGSVSGPWRNLTGRAALGDTGRRSPQWARS